MGGHKGHGRRYWGEYSNYRKPYSRASSPSRREYDDYNAEKARRQAHVDRLERLNYTARRDSTRNASGIPRFNDHDDRVNYCQAQQRGRVADKERRAQEWENGKESPMTYSYESTYSYSYVDHEKERLKKDLAVAQATSVLHVKELELMRAEMAVLRKELATERAKHT